MFGEIDHTDDDDTIEISFTPSGEITSTLLALFLPFFQSGYYPGVSIFGATDVTLNIITRAGEQLTVWNAQVTTPPPLIASGTKVFFGAMKITGLIRNNYARSTASSLFTYQAPGSVSYPGDAGFNAANILRAPFTGKWFSGVLPSGSFTVTQASPAVFSATANGFNNGDIVTIAGCTVNTALNGTWYIVSVATNTFEISATSGGSPINNTVGADSGTYVRANVGDSFYAFTTENGWQISPSVTLRAEKTDEIGTIDMTYVKASVKAKGLPVGPSVSDLSALLGIQGAGAFRGRSTSSRGLPLYLSAAGIYVKIPNASLAIEPLKFSANTKRMGEVEWESNLTFGSYVPVPLLQVATYVIA
jgi:hypothetical protein